MNKKTLIALISIGIATLLVIIYMYASKFGTDLSSQREHWGQFGDYFGGTLNPIFSFLAFTALLWSIRIQEKEMKNSTDLLKDQAARTREEIQRIQNDRVAQNITEVIKDIDKRIEKILCTAITAHAIHPQLTFEQMCSEATRIAETKETSGAYADFISFSKEKGTTLEAQAREFIHLINQMHHFLTLLSAMGEMQYKPSINYYCSKSHRLLAVATDIGGINPDAHQFFTAFSIEK